jgi:hypothetical protein
VDLNERERQLHADYEWVLHDLALQREQAGKVVAVYRRRILAVGKNHREAIQEALRGPDCPPREEIALVFVEGRTVAAG